MPFEVPFKFNFTAGDLIYGLAPMRTGLVIHLVADILNAKGPATVDQYRTSNMQTMRKVDRKSWKQFLNDNEIHPKYGRYRALIRAYNDDEESFAAAPLNPMSSNSAWRAKSKFGMEWTIKNQRGSILFVLDGIDMGAVVTKTHQFMDADGNIVAQDLPRGKATDGVQKERTITHSELRWIYRNRENPIVQARVQFWTSFGGFMHPCIPPWVNDINVTTMPSGSVLTWRCAWNAYNPTSESSNF